jgi:hypothetical protein
LACNDEKEMRRGKTFAGTGLEGIKGDISRGPTTLHFSHLFLAESE